MPWLYQYSPLSFHRSYKNGSNFFGFYVSTHQNKSTSVLCSPMLTKVGLNCPLGNMFSEYNEKPLLKHFTIIGSHQAHGTNERRYKSATVRPYKITANSRKKWVKN